ncbi:MAG: sensor histidine kinase, partial [Aquabacterium sp.]
QRATMLQAQGALGRLMQADGVRLEFDGAPPADLRPQARGFAGLGLQFWIVTALALVLYLIAASVFLSRPVLGNALYGVIALAQAGNLLLIAAESLGGLGMPSGLPGWIMPLRIGCDTLTAGAVLHVCAVHPVRLPHARWIGGAGWALAIGFTAWNLLHPVPQQWWAAQAMLLLYGLGAVSVLTWAQHLKPHPFAVTLRRLGWAANATLLLLTLSVALAGSSPGGAYAVATIGSVIWYVFFASLILLIPFLSRSQQVMREFAMLAGISTVATSLDLLFVAVFALGQFASLTLSLFIALGLYAGARQWLMTQLMGSTAPSAERMFDSLYRVARDIEAEPAQAPAHLSKLMQMLFDPLQVALAPGRRLSRARTVGEGAALVVALPDWAAGMPPTDDAPGLLLLRHARRGRHLFTDEDARLADRVLEQLSRAVAHDRAVEQGRREERTRIAQDLHDDIGARLLTLMYKSPTPEMEEYVRHTLQDLKTLTRGLAASSHHLSHAAAEWKSDLTQRLTAVQCDLRWSVTWDEDIALNVVQWSALTRVLRELINNVIAHAGATRVEVSGQFERGRLNLVVSDDGRGRDPLAWAHGLGLGGVRKRIKQLGGEVAWRQLLPTGIACEIRIPHLAAGPVRATGPR